MKQSFSKKDHIKFKKLFKIKDKPSKNDLFLIDKTKKYIKFIKWIPGLKMIGIGNSISMNSSNKNSDIDLYIVTQKNRLWLVRIITTFIFQILGVRKNTKKHKDRFCLSFFSTTKGMDFSIFSLENDIYLYFWIVYFKPILDYNNTYKNFIKANNSWACFDNYKDILNENKKYIFYKKNKETNTKKINIKRANTRFAPTRIILNFIENLLKRIFLPKTLNHFNSIGKPFGVIINNDLLKFHNSDIREKVKKELKI